MPVTLADLDIVCFDPATHDVSAFDCNDADLNDFLRNDAARYQSECVSCTRIALHRGRIVGFLTLLTDGIILKTGEKKKLFSFHKQVVTLPAVKIGRLGVRRELQRSGVGRALLKYAIGVLVRMNQDSGVGCRFITLDAYPASISWYQARGFVFNKHYAHPEKTHPSMRYDILKGPRVD